MTCHDMKLNEMTSTSLRSCLSFNKPYLVTATPLLPGPSALLQAPVGKTRPLVLQEAGQTGTQDTIAGSGG